MQPIVIGDNACTLSLDPEVPCVLMEWHGYATTAEFREATLQMGDLLRQHEMDRVLIDTTHLPIIAAEDQDWLNRVWLPQQIARGLRAAALVSSRFYFARIGVETVNRRLTPGEMAMEPFLDAATARAWLKALKVR